MSYGLFVHLEIEERRTKALGGPSWAYGAVRYASDNFPDFPEEKVVGVLRGLRWPDRPVTVSEVHRRLRLVVSSAERRVWLAYLDSPAEAPA